VSTVAHVEELRIQRAQVFEEMKTVNETAVTEKRDLSADEKEKYDRLEEQLGSLTEQVDRNERLLGIEKDAGITRRDVTEKVEERKAGEERKAPKTLKEFNEQRQASKPQDDPEYRKAFFRLLTVRDLRDLDPAEQRVLSKASAGAGANLVPTAFQRELINALRQFGVMRDIARVVTTSDGEALQWPTVTSHGTAAWTAENASYTASDEAFGQSTLNAYKAGTLIKVSEELLTDAAFDLESYIRDEFGSRIGVLQNTAYVVGDGSGKPTGVTTQASAGVTAAGAAAITADEWIDLFHSLAPQYRRNARFVTNDSSVKLARKLKDTTNQYLWQPGLQAGEPDMLLGKPIVVDPDMPAATTGLVSALFGDFSYYIIRDVDGIYFQRLNELYAENGQVGFRAYHRTDGKLLNTAAVKKLTQA
jgi:HK97 family phage major capsid protein